MTIISDDFITKYKNKTVPWGFNGLGYIIFKRTYARVKENGSTEEWVDTIQRCINGAQEIGANYTQEEAERLFDYMFHLKGLFGGRFLWQLGTETVRKYGKASLTNCWFVTITKPEDLCFLFDMLLLGGGVGFSVKQTDIGELPKIKKSVSIVHESTKDADFIVPDKREGWIALLREVLKAYFITGKSFTYSTILIRGAGEKIHGFGGKSSGPLPLVEGISQICAILNTRVGKKLRSIDVLDVCNILGSIVVSGNVRRSAQIALGNADDVLFLRAKNWNLGNVPNWRAMSNNTIYADSYTYLSDEFWNGYSGNSEPYGLFNLALSQKKGRLSDGDIEDTCEGTNPCGEVSLSSYESCVLSELCLNNITSKEELKDIAKLLYKTQKAVCALPSHWEETNKVVLRNMRIGLGVTGVCQSLDKLNWLDETYTSLKEFDEIWSKQNGWNASIKISTVKPSGTLSLLSGSTPGIHPAFSRFYIRRVRLSRNDDLVAICKNAGYMVEYLINFDGTYNYDTVVVEFPCYSDRDTILAQDMTATQQLELVKTLQSIWSDNAVSATVYYKKDELHDIKQWLEENYEHSIKSVSFLLHSEHGFRQAPYEEITEQVYRDSIKNIQPIRIQSIGNLLENLECSSGACPIR